MNALIGDFGPVWLDPSDETVVAVCDECRTQYGPFTRTGDAEAFAGRHATSHAAD